MRQSDIDTLLEIKQAMLEIISNTETLTNNMNSLLSHVDTLCDSFQEKHHKQKQVYQAKAEYHKRISKEWRKENRERHNAYQRAYYKQKKKKEAENVAGTLQAGQNGGHFPVKPE